MIMSTYPSSISRSSFELIEPILTLGVKQTRPRKTDLYDVFCAILYILKSGCQWSMLPRDFPPKSTVYYYFKQWSLRHDGQPSKLDLALKKMCL